MSLATVDALRSTLGVGALYTDAQLQTVCDAADAVLVPMLETGYDTTDPALQHAALMLAVDIWQTKNAAGVGSIGPDGTPMPYRMGNSMLGRVRGLIAHAIDVLDVGVNR